MLPLLSLLRFPNLLIILATQYLLRQLVLAPPLYNAGVPLSLGELQFFLLVLCTVLLAAGGYVINDIMDVETDLLNKPGRVFIRSTISEKSACRVYLLLLTAGLAIAVSLALYVGNLALVSMYPVAAGLLWLYSYRLKKLPLWGNLVVALFCAFVPGIVWFAERQALRQLENIHPTAASHMHLLFAWYLAFAFFSTLFREIVKDIEDLDGDKNTGARTFPVTFGVVPAKRVAIASAILLLATLVCFLLQRFDLGTLPVAGWAFASVGIILPLLYSVGVLKDAKKKESFSRLSLIIKGVMASGLILLVILEWNR